MANEAEIATDFLNRFVARGAGHWREEIRDDSQQALARRLPRVQAELAALGDVGEDPDALPDAIEAAVLASAMALADPRRSAALNQLGFTKGSRGRSKTDREELAAGALNRSARWFRTPTVAEGKAPRASLLGLVAEKLAASSGEAGLSASAAGIDVDAAGQRLPLASATDAETARVWRTFPYDRVTAAIGSASKRVRILQSWVPDAQPFVSSIRAALTNGAAVEVLILDPRCDAAARRAVALGIDDEDYAYYHAVKLLGDLRPLTKKCEPGQLAVRTSLTEPFAQIYGTETHLWVGFFWPAQYSMQAPQVEVTTPQSPLGQAFSEYFDALWCVGSPLAASELKR